MYPGEGACCNAKTRVNASLADARREKAWKREAVFNGVETIAEMNTERFGAEFDSEPFNTKLYNPR